MEDLLQIHIIGSPQDISQPAGSGEMLKLAMKCSNYVPFSQDLIPKVIEKLTHVLHRRYSLIDFGMPSAVGAVCDGFFARPSGGCRFDLDLAVHSKNRASMPEIKS